MQTLTSKGVSHEAKKESLRCCGNRRRHRDWLLDLLRHSAVADNEEICALLFCHHNATVTICHTRTQNLPQHTRRADILYVSVGKAEFVTAEMVKPGAIVIDTGYNRLPDRKGDVGDVHFESVKEVASFLTPVPGGVGPMTVTMLLANTLLAAQRLVQPEGA